jgi:predicted ATP-dependent endonuclease of OLD family
MAHLKGIGLKNFRVFKYYQEFEFRPLTILTGPNNSGKSSLIKFLLLIKENLNFFNSVLKQGKIEESRISFSSSIHKLSGFNSIINDNSNPLFIKFHIINEIYICFKINKERRSEHSINFCNHNNSDIIVLAGNKLTINLKLFIKYFASGQIVISASDNPADDAEWANYMGENFDRISNYAKRMKEDIVSFDLREMTVNEKEKKESRAGKKTIITEIDRLRSAINFFIDFDPIASHYPFLFDAFDSYFNFEFFENIFYLPSIKGFQNRVYQNNDESYLNSLIRSIYELGFTNIASEKFIDKWIKKFGLGEKLNFGYDEKLGVNFIFIDNKSLVDLGFGLTQIISILLQTTELIIRYGIKEDKEKYRPVLILEEPETNLHPSFQSKLAEMLVEIVKSFNIKIIIETHSEYLIRKLQYLTANKAIGPGASVIYYFNHPNEVAKGSEQVKEIKILEDGSLSDDFGPGFFDEATNIKFDLLKLKNPQKN